MAAQRALVLPSEGGSDRPQLCGAQTTQTLFLVQPKQNETQSDGLKRSRHAGVLVVFPHVCPREQRVNQSPDVSVGESFLHQHNPFIQDRNNLFSSSSQGTSLRRMPGNSCFLVVVFYPAATAATSTDLQTELNRRWSATWRESVFRSAAASFITFTFIIKNIERFWVEIDWNILQKCWWYSHKLVLELKFNSHLLVIIWLVFRAIGECLSFKTELG